MLKCICFTTSYPSGFSCMGDSPYHCINCVEKLPGVIECITTVGFWVASSATAFARSLGVNSVECMFSFLVSFPLTVFVYCSFLYQSFFSHIAHPGRKEIALERRSQERVFVSFGTCSDSECVFVSLQAKSH